MSLSTSGRLLTPNYLSISSIFFFFYYLLILIYGDSEKKKREERMAESQPPKANEAITKCTGDAHLTML